MKRGLAVALLFSVLGTWMLPAQNPARIKSDPEMIWAEGTGSGPAEADRAALDALVWKLSHFADFQVSPSRKAAVAGTYLSELRRRAGSYYSDGTMLRYLPIREVEELFRVRERRAVEIQAAADAKADRGEAARMYRWSWSYRASLPGDHRRELSALKQRIRQCGNTETSVLPPVPASLQHIAREADLIAAALGLDYQESPVPQQASSPEGGGEDRNRRLQERRDSLKKAFAPILPAPEVSSGISGPGAAPSAFCRRETLSPEPLRKVRPSAVLGTFSLSPEPMAGVVFLYCRRRWGFCADGGKTLSSGVPESFPARSDGVGGDRFLWPSGAVRTTGFFFSAGPAFRFSPALSVFVTGGYGCRSIFWEDVDGSWANIRDRSVKGPAIGAGGIVQTGPLAFSFAFRTFAFRTAGLSAGIGVSF